VRSKDGYAGWTAKYNEKGKVIYESYFDTNGKAILNQSGYAAIRYKYDDYGNTIRADYFGIDGQPVRSKDGYAGWTAKYNENAKVIYSYFDTNGKAVDLPPEN
jgi:hypothetical protein